METLKSNIHKDESSSPRAKIRLLDADAWIEAHASGTLRKSKKIGFAWRSLYLEERTAYEWGWGFQILPRTRVTFGDPIIEGDNHPLTEASWHIERYLTLNPFPQTDHFEAKYLHVKGNEKKIEGVGMVCRTTSARWIPDGHLVFSIVAEFDPSTDTFSSAENPFLWTGTQFVDHRNSIVLCGSSEQPELGSQHSQSLWPKKVGPRFSSVGLSFDR